MHAHTGILAVVGSVCMTLALVLAWCLAGVRSSRFVKRCFPNPQYLLKAHLDFLMMTGHAAPGDIAQALAAGVVRCFPKPLAFEDLCAALAELDGGKDEGT